MKVRLSVIIPIFGVERFIEKCAESLMSQTMTDEVEFIFVDDASKDRSREILETVIARYPGRLKQVRILTHEVNKGLPAARNTGLAVATGEYVYHFDGDDYAEPDLFERMLNTAEATDAEYVWADWILSYEHSDRLMKQPEFTDASEALEGMLKGQMKYNVWNKIVKRSLYVDNEIVFPEGHGMGEDMTMIRLLACAKSVDHVDYAGYHYVKTNNNAMTSNVSEQSYKDIFHNVAETGAFLKKMCGNGMEPLLASFCLHTKFPLLISSDRHNYQRWKSMWPESNRYIGSSGFSLRNRLLNQWAALGLWPLVKLHFYAYNFLYRTIFR